MQTESVLKNSGGTKFRHKMHWTMAFIAMICLLISNGMTIVGLTAFDGEILNEFSDWSRGDLKTRGLVTFALVGLLAPFVGIIIDRIGVRLLMIFGSLLLSISYFFYSRIDSLMDLYIMHALFAVVLLCAGLNVAVILVSNWFVKRRGMAIGIAVIGTSLGGAIMTPVFGSWVADGMTWREGFQIASVIPLILLLLAIFLVKNTPADASLSPYGKNQALSDESDVSNHGMEYKDALKTRSFWAIAIIAMFTFYTIMGFQANLFLHLQDLGFSVQGAANGITVLFVPALIGKFLFGAIADKLEGRLLLYVNLIIMLLGFISLQFINPDYILVSIGVIGFMWGGFYTMLQLNAINNFGLKASGKLLGTITVLDALGGGLGIVITGKIFDIYGSYENAFWIYVVLVAIAVVLISQIKKHV